MEQEKKRNPITSVSEIICWLALGSAFPVTTLLARKILEDAPKLYEKIYPDDMPLPVITTFAINNAGALPFLSLAGLISCAVGIWLRRYEPIRNHQLFIITMGWVTLFQILGTAIIAVWMPVISATVPHSH